MNLSTSIEKDITSIDSIVEEFSRIKEEIKSFGIYVDPFITTTNYILSLPNHREREKNNIALYHPQAQQYMKYSGSDGDIDLSSTQHICLLGSDTISQSLENTHMKKKDTMTIKDPTLLEVIKDNSVSFEKKTINHTTAENVIVT